MDMLFIKGKYKSKYYNLCLLKNSALFACIPVRKSNGPYKCDLNIPEEYLNQGDLILYV